MAPTQAAVWRVAAPAAPALSELQTSSAGGLPGGLAVFWRAIPAKSLAHLYCQAEVNGFYFSFFLLLFSFSYVFSLKATPKVAFKEKTHRAGQRRNEK